MYFVLHCIAICKRTITARTLISIPTCTMSKWYFHLSISFKSLLIHKCSFDACMCAHMYSEFRFIYLDLYLDSRYSVEHKTGSLRYNYGFLKQKPKHVDWSPNEWIQSTWCCYCWCCRCRCRCCFNNIYFFASLSLFCHTLHVSLLLRFYVLSVFILCHLFSRFTGRFIDNCSRIFLSLLLLAFLSID